MLNVFMKSVTVIKLFFIVCLMICSWLLICFIYLRFHTSFLEEVSSTTDKKQYYLKLSREEIDNPHKPKTWDTYTEKFQIEMYFSECDITS